MTDNQKFLANLVLAITPIFAETWCKLQLQRASEEENPPDGTFAAYVKGLKSGKY